VNIDPRWAQVVTGVHRIGGELMLILDLERALGRVSADLAA
jgi:purine-binding chemotaxis protein CheW